MVVRSVDVSTDVDREILRSRARAGALSAAKHLILGQVLLPPAFPQRSWILHARLGGIPAA